MPYLTHDPSQKFTAHSLAQIRPRSGFRLRPDMKLVAKPSPPSLAVAIHAVDLLLNILFELFVELLPAV